MEEKSISEEVLRIASIQDQLSEIIARNKRVEADKAWEVSKFRVGSIIVLTSAITCIMFYILGVAEFYLSAIIPTLGYFLSTQGLPILKNFWIHYYYRQ